MIVKNEEKHLKKCLDSVISLVDEIVIVDTGSSDKTLEIAKSFNSKILHFEWINDFSAARNFALKKSTGDFILYLDADEILSDKSKNYIKNLVKNKDKIGYLCTITSIDEFSKQNNSIQYVRFFRNSDNIKFVGKAHEQITDSLIESGYKILPSEIEIIHYGYNISKDEKKIKAERNLNLLLKEYETNKSEYIAFQIGQSYFILENFDEAEKYFKQAISNGNLSKDLQAESYSYLAQINHFRFDISSTEVNIKKALSLNNNQPFYYYLYSKVLQRKMDYQNSYLNLKKAYELNNFLSKLKRNNIQSVHLNNYEVLISLISLSIKNNDRKSLSFYGNELFKEVKKNNYENKEHYGMLLKILSGNHNPSNNDLVKLIEIIDEINLELFLLIIDSISDVQNKLEVVLRLNKSFPNNVELLKRIAIIFNSDNKTEHAIEILEKNFDKIQSDPSTLFYLASFHIKNNNSRRALEIFDLIENKFPQISALNSKVNEIKEKIKQYI